MTTRSASALCLLGFLLLPLHISFAASPEFVIPLFPSATDPHGRQGFLRILNQTEQAGLVNIEAIDESGKSFGSFDRRLDPNRNLHINSDDLEQDLAVAEPVEGHWRLIVQSEDLDDILPLAYIRWPDGFLSPMNGSRESVETSNPEYPYSVHLSTVNPGSNWSKVSQLRIINTCDERNQLTVSGNDDWGTPVQRPYVFELGARETRTLSAMDLETEWAQDGRGKWEVLVASECPVRIVNLIESTETGHLVNMSVHKVDVVEIKPPPPPLAPQDQVAFFALVQGRKLCLSGCGLGDHTFYFNDLPAGESAAGAANVTHFLPPNLHSLPDDDFDDVTSGEWRYRPAGPDSGALTIEYHPSLGVDPFPESSYTCYYALEFTTTMSGRLSSRCVETDVVTLTHRRFYGPRGPFQVLNRGDERGPFD